MMTPNRFKELRIKLGYSQQDMATRLGLASERSVRYYETGRQAVPKPVALLMYLYSGEKTIMELLK